MTDKEYIRRYADTADRAQRENLPARPSDPTNRKHQDEFLRRFRRRAKGIAERNAGNMPDGPSRDRAMKRSIRRVRDGAGVLHVQPDSRHSGGSTSTPNALNSRRCSPGSPSASIVPR